MTSNIKLPPHVIMLTLSCLVLSACQSTQDTRNSAASASASAPAPASLSYTPTTFHMPTGSGCQGNIDRWQAVQNNDLQLGHVSQSVYNQIQSEIKAAQTECSAGHDAQASAMIVASKHKHGYPN